MSESERETLARLTFAKRRREWLLGRWAAKRLLQHSQAAYRSLPLDAITVDNDPNGAPFLHVAGEGRLPASLSISHRDDRAFCALSPSCPPSVGADIEHVELRAPAFVRDFFTMDEAERVWACPRPLRDTLVTVLWSAKEAVLKALRYGLRVDTRRVEIRHVAGIEQSQAPDIADAHGDVGLHPFEVRPVPEEWHEVQVSCSLLDAAPLSAWWRPEGDYVLTLTALSPTPVTLAPDLRSIPEDSQNLPNVL